MKRREFLQGMVVAIAALVLPPGKAEPVVRVPHTAGRTVLDNFGISSKPEMLFGRPIVYTDALPDIGGDIVLGDLSAYIEGTLIKRIPVSQEILDDCIAGGDAWRGVRLSELERTILDGNA